MRKSRQIPILWWVIWSLLVVTENGETLLADPNYEELMAQQAEANLGLEGQATAEARGILKNELWICIHCTAKFYLKI